MKTSGRSHSKGPILRSVSLEDLKRNSSFKNTLKYTDEVSPLKEPKVGTLSNEELLKDLDNMLRNKLNIGRSTFHADKRNKSDGNISALNFKAKSGLEGDIQTIDIQQDDEDVDDSRDDADNFKLNDNSANNGEDGEKGGNTDNAIEFQDDAEEAEEENEDESFANVDELDGFDLNKVADGKHAPVNEKGEVDYNMPVDKEFQKSLDQCAASLEGRANAPYALQRAVDWELRMFYSLEQELSDWFCSSDYIHFGQAQTQFKQKVKDPQLFFDNETYAASAVERLVEDISNSLTSNLLALTYISMGCFAYISNKNEHEKVIRRNNLMFVPHVEKIVHVFKKIAISCRDDNKNLKKQTILLFHSSTILYFITGICISSKDENSEAVDLVVDAFDKANLLVFLTRYIESWRWNSRLSMRIRNMILLLFKLIVLQFGDDSVYKETKSSIYKIHGLVYPSKYPKKLSISPLHYQAFREDITSRFPDYNMPTSDLPKDVDKSESLSQFLEIPRPKSKNPLNMTLNVPEKHIATPAPSPPSSPQLMHLGEGPRPRKSFQTNMAYPCLYPSDDEEPEDDTLEDRMDLNFGKKLDNDIVIPFSTEEAAKILSENLKVKLGAKQLWYERDLFMITERGWKQQSEKDPYDYSTFNHDDELSKKERDAVLIMQRIDKYYKSCLSSFNSLVFVLLQTMESSLTNNFHRKTEVSDKNLLNMLAPQLEVVRAKELSLKSAAGILHALLKWFKLSHILKFEHLAVVIHDSRYINTCASILSKYSEIYSERIFSKYVRTSSSFWRECSLSNKNYRESYSIDDSKEVDTEVLPSFAYLLRILRKITGNKTQRLKELPLSIGILFKRYYRLFNLDMYHPILKITRELTPFKNKRWKSEHMELISGVYLYEKLELTDNWVTGKDISGELSDACGQEIALRALLQFYNFQHYETSMEDLGYGHRNSSSQDLLNKESEYLNI
ncbi:hypothetical protein SKDZ_14G1970 [Saccharomyces kudriavzevii ZP591]|nr:hypothetical protein SKDZ_14G1970 [Saccharomyces kudriavzevii ZP591]